MTDRAKPPRATPDRNAPNGPVHKERLSDALRENLRRRKEQARERGPDEAPQRPTVLRPEGK
jgi:hypothetical protein